MQPRGIPSIEPLGIKLLLKLPLLVRRRSSLHYVLFAFFLLVLTQWSLFHRDSDYTIVKHNKALECGGEAITNDKTQLFLLYVDVQKSIL